MSHTNKILFTDEDDEEEGDEVSDSGLEKLSEYSITIRNMLRKYPLVH